MLTKDEARALMAQIKENHRKLNSCPKHVFGDVVGAGAFEQPRNSRERICTSCGGEMADLKIILYVRGYKAAGGNPDDVARYCDGESIA